MRRNMREFAVNRSIIIDAYIRWTAGLAGVDTISRGMRPIFKSVYFLRRAMTELRLPSLGRTSPVRGNDSISCFSGCCIPEEGL